MRITPAPVLFALVLAIASAQDASGAPLPDLVEARQEVAAAYLDGSLYVVGGFGTGGETLASAERWRDGADAWETLSDMPIAVNHPAAVAVGGRLVVVGGFRGPVLRNAVDATQVFDPETGAWTLAAPMPSARGGLAAVVVDGRVVALGGARDGVALADVAVYDPSEDRWTPWPPMAVARDHLGAAVVGGAVHVIGGRAGGDFTMGAHEVLDPVALTWSAAPPLPTGRSGHAVAALDGCVYVLGGEGNRARPDGMFDEVERYVVATQSWEALPPMPVARHGMGAVPADGRLLVPAGATVAGFGAAALADAVTPPPCGAE
jgi:N-acetylneuraminic acid mutarotase